MTSVPYPFRSQMAKVEREQKFSEVRVTRVAAKITHLGDIFLGGAGDDSVTANRGTVYGGAATLQPQESATVGSPQPPATASSSRSESSPPSPATGEALGSTR